MKNFFYSIILILISLFTAVTIYLSTVGLETSRINSLIIKEIVDKEPKIKLKLDKITIKLDIKKIQLFLSTNNPKITYEGIKVPITKIKIYSKLKNILSSKLEVSQIVFTLKEFLFISLKTF